MYYPVPFHRQECYAGLTPPDRVFPNADEASARVLALPVYPELTRAQQEHVVSSIAEWLRVKAPRVLLTGASGQLGAAVAAPSQTGTWYAHTSATLDISDPVAVRRTVADTRPDVVVNCAAFNDVDGAEDRPFDAFAVNAFAVRSLARASEEAGAMLVHYSTDFVFDGTASEPYDEDSPPSPRSKYAASKLLGEWFALDAPRALVLRVESLFGTPRSWTGRRGSLESIVDGLEHGREIRVFTDRTVSPGYVARHRCRHASSRCGRRGSGRVSLRERRGGGLGRHCHGSGAAACRRASAQSDHHRSGLAQGEPSPVQRAFDR